VLLIGSTRFDELEIDARSSSDDLCFVKGNSQYYTSGKSMNFDLVEAKNQTSFLIAILVK